MESVEHQDGQEFRYSGQSASAPGHATTVAVRLPDESSAHRNYFNQELYGGPTTLPWALRIDPVHRPVDTPTIGLYHPTFLYVRPAAHRLRDPADAGEREKLAEFLGVDEESLDATMVR